MTTWVWVALGGALGASARYGVVQWLQMFTLWPLGTLTVNVLGSGLIGLAYAYAEQRGLSAAWMGFVLVGMLGGFTTVSSWSLELAQWLQSGLWLRVFAYSVLTISLCVGATLLGLAYGRSLA